MRLWHVAMVGIVMMGFAAASQAQMLGISWDGTVGRINPTTGAYTVLGPSGAQNTNAMARDAAGQLYTTQGQWLYGLDPATGAGTFLANLHIGDVRAIAISPAGQLYAAIDHQTPQGVHLPDDLYRVNMADYSATLVGSLGVTGVQGLAFSNSGQLWGWDVGPNGYNGMGLVRIDPASASVQDVNASIGGDHTIQTLAFSPDDRLYGARYGLFSIDTASGVPTAIGAGWSADVRGIEFVVPEPTAASLLATGAAGLLLRRRRAR